MFSFRTTPLEDQLDKALLEGRVACFCTQNCWDTARGNYMYELFRERGNLATVFSPRDTELTPLTNHIEFTPEVLEGLNAVVVEIQDVGVRYFNYTRDVMHLMEVLSKMEEAPSLYIVDHVNPAGRVVEGSMPQGACEAWVPKVPHRHGLSLGELCLLYHSELGAKFALHVISANASEATRDLLPWAIAPCSDIPGMFTCELYSGGGLWNNTNVSPGIGTARPYEYIGAPFIKTGSGTPLPPSDDNVLMRPCSFTPACGRYEGTKCFGYQILLRPNPEYHSLVHTLRLMRHLKSTTADFALDQEFSLKLSDPVMEAYIMGEAGSQDLVQHVKTEEQKWIRKAKKYLLYDDQPFRIKSDFSD